jgi:hypothetical protein
LTNNNSYAILSIERDKNMRKFENGQKVKVIETGHKATIYDYDTFLGEEKVLIRFNGRHSLDLFKESELESY